MGAAKHRSNVIVVWQTSSKNQVVPANNNVSKEAKGLVNSLHEPMSGNGNTLNNLQVSEEGEKVDQKSCYSRCWVRYTHAAPNKIPA